MAPGHMFKSIKKLETDLVINSEAHLITTHCLFEPDDLFFLMLSRKFLVNCFSFHVTSVSLLTFPPLRSTPHKYLKLFHSG